MKGPVLQLTTDYNFYKLQQLLWKHKKLDILNSLRNYNAFTLIYDADDGDLILTLYKDNRLEVQHHLAFGSKLDCNKVWQYFYTPEHRVDEEW